MIINSYNINFYSTKLFVDKNFFFWTQKNIYPCQLKHLPEYLNISLKERKL